MNCHYGMSLSDLHRVATRLGVEIRKLPCTGEVSYIYPGINVRPRINVRKKDAPRFAIRFVMKVAELQKNGD